MTDVAVDAKNIPAAVQLRKDVNAAVDECQQRGEVRGMVKNDLVAAKLKERKEILAKALVVRETLARELNKIKPDIVNFNENNEKQSEFYTKAKAKELQKAREKLTKCDKALDQCINDANYDALQKWQKGGSDGGKDDCCEAS